MQNKPFRSQYMLGVQIRALIMRSFATYFTFVFICFKVFISSTEHESFLTVQLFLR